MASPITGPFSKSSPQTTGTPSFWWNRKVYRQVKPYDRNLLYEANFHYALKKTILLGNPTASEWNEAAWTASQANSSGLRAWDRLHAVNERTIYEGALNFSASRAREKLLVKFNQEKDAALGALIAEGREAGLMIAARGGQLLKLTRSLSRGRFGDAFHTLEQALGADRMDANYRKMKSDFLRRRSHLKTVSNPKNRQDSWPALRARTKAGYSTLSDHILEMMFGWLPLFGDIESALEVITTPYKDGQLKAVSGQRGLTYVHTSTNSSTKERRRMKHTYSVLAVVGGTVKVSNPNLYAANRLGLINLVDIAWQVTPFSFLLDYVTNIGDVCKSLTSMAGINVVDPFTTEVLDDTCVTLVEKYEYFYGPPWTVEWTSRAKTVRRKLTWPSGPSVRLKSFQLFPQRALTSVALLGQFLDRKKF